MVFCIKNGYIDYQVMPFGLYIAPINFQNYINKILAEKHDMFVVIYLDNILIYTENSGQPHVKVV